MSDPDEKPATVERVSRSRGSPKRRADHSRGPVERLSVDLPQALMDHMRVYAARRRCSLSFATEQALRALLEAAE